MLHHMLGHTKKLPLKLIHKPHSKSYVYENAAVRAMISMPRKVGYSFYFAYSGKNCSKNFKSTDHPSLYKEFTQASISKRILFC